MSNLINMQVYCKRDGSQGTVVAVDEQSGTLTIDLGGKSKVITNSTYKRWYTLIPSDKPESISTATQVTSDSDNTNATDTDKPKAQSKTTTKLESGEAGIGVTLRDKFIKLVKENELPEVEIFVNNEKHTDVIKFNKKNAFECSYAKGRFNVLCHPDSLTPDNKKRVTKMCPKDWGWVLRARFTFTSLDQVPLMKSIIADGLYFRKDGKANE